MMLRMSDEQISQVRKGFNILELIPGGQGPLVYTARELWRLEWKVSIIGILSDYQLTP